MARRTCCSPSSNQGKVDDENSTNATDVKREVRRRYGELARSKGGSCCGSGSAPVRAEGRSCCGAESATSLAGYNEEQMRNLPEKASAASAGCGNPTALAELKEGEIVLDLGSGGGIDVLLAAQKVGSKGRAIGVDMTSDMVDLARENALKSGLGNVEFRLGEIEHLPVADESVDVIISNCVINLSTDKDQVFREAYRVLRRGGRMLVSDTMAKGMTDDVRKDFSMWAQCIGGAIDLEDYLSSIRGAGFVDVEVVSSSDYPKEFVKGSIEDASLLEKVEGITVSHAEIRAKKIY